MGEPVVLLKGLVYEWKLLVPIYIRTFSIYKKINLPDVIPNQRYKNVSGNFCHQVLTSCYV